VFGLSPLEIVAAVFGAVSVWLSVRQHIASWPTAIVNVLLYVVVFYRARLYADMGLQFVYAALSVYGWYEWKFGGADRTELPVTRTPRAAWPALAAVGLAGGAALGVLFARHTNAANPYLDSALTAASLVAQWMMTRKLLENWLLWVAADLVYVPLYVAKNLYPTAVLYAVFLGLAAKGYVDWRRDLLGRQSTAAPATAAA
jgi:nicotinamide mononucleotide transporter